MVTRSCRASTEPLRIDRLGTVEYLTAWDVQRANADARRAGAGPDVLMLLEHPSVYTAGKRWSAAPPRPAGGRGAPAPSPRPAARAPRPRGPPRAAPPGPRPPARSSAQAPPPAPQAPPQPG